MYFIDDELIEDFCDLCGRRLKPEEIKNALPHASLCNRCRGVGSKIGKKQNKRVKSAAW